MTGAPFTLYRRKESGAWYVRFRVPDGSWSNPRSTRQYKKRDAIEWAERQIAVSGLPVTRRRIRFGVFARGFFDVGGTYESHHSAFHGAIRGATLRNHRARLNNYLIPVFSSIYLDDMTAGRIGKALLYIRDNHAPHRNTETGALAARTLNNIRSSLAEVLAHAVREGLLPTNPIENVARFSEKPKKRGILTAVEIRTLLDRGTVGEVWTSPAYWLCTCIAAATGARSGEIRTLHREDVIDGFLILRRSFDDVDGETADTKTKAPRTVPIPKALEMDLLRWATTNEIQPSELLFWSPTYGRSEPLDRDTLLKNYKRALQKIGIPAHEQRRRNIPFHCLRHSVAALLAGHGTDLWTVRQLTGHRSTAAFNGYIDHSDTVDWTGVKNWQGAILAPEPSRR